VIGLERLQRWWTQHLLHRHRISWPVWRQLLETSPLLARLNKKEQHRLRELTSLFLHRKVLVGADGFELDEMARALIAAQASLLILNLGLDWYDGWSEIIVYPGAFLAPHRERDEAGVVHEGPRGLSGEAWGRGPVILSWSDINPTTRQQRRSGSNVVLHEFAHKIDFLDGAANGIPPLHQGNTVQQWAEVFSRSYADLTQRSDQHAAGIDLYATTNPAEFFAVVTELFFEEPQRLQHSYPAIYDELRRFYRQDPLSRPCADPCNSEV
jgi:Mlc titration factor MtfA (ptsG expression regulator)